MSEFIKAAGLVLVSVILCLCVSSVSKPFSVLIALGVCCMVGVAALGYMRPILDFIDDLRSIVSWDDSMISVLLKAVGIGLLSEIAMMICTDSGNSAMAKSLQILTTAVMLWVSLPLFSNLLDLVGQLLEEL